MAEATKNAVTMNGREFTIEPPDAIVTLRLLRVVGKVGARAQKAAERLGLALFQAKQAADAEEAQSASDGVNQAMWVLLSVLEEDDLYKLGAALLQFPEERDGVRWLKKNGVQLSPLVRALMLNLEQMDDLLEAVSDFTKMLSGLRLGTLSNAMAATSSPQPGD